MPRSQKRRHVCGLPEFNEFRPVTDNAVSTDQIVLTVDEYETIRLIDYKGLSQEECSEYMQVGRTTVQAIYTAARKKIATAIVNGQSLLIRGGSYCLCEGEETHRGCRECHRHRKHRVMQMKYTVK